ncbi:MAG: NAD(P)/FAD-dependent oxidoreductase [Acidobacteriota bacterium]
MISDALIIGAGPSGLATSRELSRAGVAHRVLERGSWVGHTWANLYDGLVLHTGKHFSALPGMAFSRSTPLFPPRRDFVAYLHRYAEHFRIPVDAGTEVAGLERVGDGWLVRTSQGAELRARSVVVATGIVSSPRVAEIAQRDRFRGRVFHSADYRRPDAFAGQRVLVVGAGNSSGEIAAELSAAGAQVTVAIRSGARVVPLRLFGIPIQYLAVAMSVLPRPLQRGIQAATGRMSEVARGGRVLPAPSDSPCSNVPLIGFHLADAVRAGTIRLRGGVAAFTASGVQFSDGSAEPFDQVILATGYTAALGPLGDLIRRDPCGFAARHHRVVSADQPDLYFVGHNYDTRGALMNIARDARLAARLIAGRSQ